MLVAQDLSSNAQHHRPVTIDQGRECRLVPLLYEPFEQLTVVQPARRPGAEE